MKRWEKFFYVLVDQHKETRQLKENMDARIGDRFEQVHITRGIGSGLG